jgi:hypothetical protein
MKKALLVMMSIAFLCNAALAQAINEAERLIPDGYEMGLSQNAAQARKEVKRIMAENYEQAMGLSQDEIEELYTDYEEHLGGNEQFQELMLCGWSPDFFGTDGSIQTESYIKVENNSYWKSIVNNGQENLYNKYTDFSYSLNFAFSPILQVLNSNCFDDYKRDIISAALNSSFENKKNTLNPCVVEDFAMATCSIQKNGREKYKGICKGKCFKRINIADEIKDDSQKIKLFNEALKNSQFGDYKKVEEYGEPDPVTGEREVIFKIVKR